MNTSYPIIWNLFWFLPRKSPVYFPCSSPLPFNLSIISLNHYFKLHISQVPQNSSPTCHIAHYFSIFTLFWKTATPSSLYSPPQTRHQLRSVRGFALQKSLESPVLQLTVGDKTSSPAPENEEWPQWAWTSRSCGLRTLGGRCTVPFRPCWQESPEGRGRRSAGPQHWRRSCSSCWSPEPQLFSLLPSCRAVSWQQTPRPSHSPRHQGLSVIRRRVLSGPRLRQLRRQWGPHSSSVQYIAWLTASKEPTRSTDLEILNKREDVEWEEMRFLRFRI